MLWLCIELHHGALLVFTRNLIFRSRMLLLTGALMVTALSEVCRAEADQRYYPQEADWISEKVSIFFAPDPMRARPPYNTRDKNVVGA